MCRKCSAVLLLKTCAYTSRGGQGFFVIFLFFDPKWPQHMIFVWKNGALPLVGSKNGISDVFGPYLTLFWRPVCHTKSRCEDKIYDIWKVNFSDFTESTGEYLIKYLVRTLFRKSCNGTNLVTGSAGFRIPRPPLLLRRSRLLSAGCSSRSWMSSSAAVQSRSRATSSHRQ